MDMNRTTVLVTILLCYNQLCGGVNLTADRLLLLELEHKYMNVYNPPSQYWPLRRTTKSEKDIMDSLNACPDSDALLDKMITKVQDCLERVVAFIKLHGSSTTLSRIQLKRLQRYRNQLHGDNFISVFKCPICSVKFITFIGLWKHMSGLHNIYLRAKGMLSTVIAKDTFITPRKLILKKKPRTTKVTTTNKTEIPEHDPNMPEDEAPETTDDVPPEMTEYTEITEPARKMLRKIRKRKNSGETTPDGIGGYDDVMMREDEREDMAGRVLRGGRAYEGRKRFPDDMLGDREPDYDS